MYNIYLQEQKLINITVAKGIKIDYPYSYPIKSMIKIYYFRSIWKKIRIIDGRLHNESITNIFS